MKKARIFPWFLGVAAALLLPAPLGAMKPFFRLFNRVYAPKVGSPLADAACQICHIRKEGGRKGGWNPYGQDVHKLLEEAEDESLTREMLAVLEGKDSDGDGHSNKEEIEAGTLPGDPISFPGSAETEVQHQPPTESQAAAQPTPHGKKPVASHPKQGETSETSLPARELVAEESAANAGGETPFEESGGADSDESRRHESHTEERGKDKGESLIPEHSFHPALVHFPIALFLFSGFLDFLAIRRRSSALHRAAEWNLYGAAASSIPTVATGLAFWLREGEELKGLLLYHLVAAVIAASLMLCLAAVRRRGIETMPAAKLSAYWLFTLLGLSAVVLAGFFGGEMVFGGD